MKAQISNDRPTMKPLEMGEIFRTLQVTAKKGMHMPSHHATEEAVIVVLEGEGLLIYTESQQKLKVGESAVIPAGLDHELKVLEDFKAIVVMPKTGSIEF